MPKEENTTDAAAEAKKYGQLVVANEKLTADNKRLTKENEDLEQAVRNNTSLRAKEEKAIEELGEQANQLRREQRDQIKEGNAELDAREARLDEREKELEASEKKMAVAKEELQLREDNVTAREVGVSTQRTDLKTLEGKVKAEHERQNVREAELKEAAIALKKFNDQNKLDLKANTQTLEEITDERERNDAVLASTKTEVAKLQDLTGKMRSENEVNKKIKQQMELTIPRMQNLIAVLREFQDFISAHVRNPDAIDNKFTEIARKLDIVINPPKEENV